MVLITHVMVKSLTSHFTKSQVGSTCPKYQSDPLSLTNKRPPRLSTKPLGFNEFNELAQLVNQLPEEHEEDGYN
ncbi:hypothetical protein VV208B2_45260 (plasmid) [Vibrio vulnificus]|nr:hypothetical protein VV208B2_45260 [Vibrio vulnificus]